MLKKTKTRNKRIIKTKQDNDKKHKMKTLTITKTRNKTLTTKNGTNMYINKEYVLLNQNPV